MNLCFHFLWVKVPTHQKVLFVAKLQSDTTYRPSVKALVHSTLQRSIIASFSIDTAKVIKKNNLHSAVSCLLQNYYNFTTNCIYFS